MKKLCLLLAALILMCALAVPAFAAQADKPIHVAGNTYYDPVQKAFLYYVNVSASQVIRSNVADGMITAQAVSIESDAGAALQIYLNGQRVEGISGGVFQTPGEYVVMYAVGAATERIMAFTIVPELCNYVTAYALPAGFEVVEATLNGAPISFDKSYIKLTDEGKYDIRYRCLKTNVSYQLLLQTDFTGPTLSLGEVANGVARGPVDISDARSAAVVNIYHDGERINREDVLTESGEYYIELADEAGNMITYSFTIMVYFDGNSWLFLVMVFAACVGVVVYLLHSRRHLRVR